MPGLGDQQSSLTFLSFRQLGGFSLNPGFQQKGGFSIALSLSRYPTTTDPMVSPVATTGCKGLSQPRDSERAPPAGQKGRSLVKFANNSRRCTADPETNLKGTVKQARSDTIFPFNIHSRRKIRPAVKKRAAEPKAFSDAALDALWEQIDSLEPLMKLIPSSAREHEGAEEDEDGLMLLTRPLQAAEVAWISLYLRCVRVLTYDHDGDFPYRTVIGKLADYLEPSPLLPRLTSLTYRYESDSKVPHMIANLDTLLLICPTFQKLTIEGDASAHWTSRGNRDQKYFDVLPKMLPQIRDFVLNTDFTIPKLQFAAEFKHLRSLEIGVANEYGDQPRYLRAVTLQAMAGLRDLELLSIRPFDISAWASAPRIPGFPSLQRVHIAQGDDAGAYVLLSSVTSPFLSEIDITLESGEYHWKRDIAQSFTLLPTNFGISLESLTWSAVLPSNTQGFEEFKAHLLRPLLALPRLKYLDLQFFASLISSEWLVFSPQDAEEMSRAWVNLEFLSFFTDFSSFSLASLITLVLKCQHLIYLEIPTLLVDDDQIEMASHIPPINEPPRFLELRIRRAFRDSSSPHPQPVSACLHQVFPPLRIL
ncbi:hypothetical protein JAAARDRAFT_198240 [Jaapia argillacea MUCL 33604]|uniref:F-box domain-containing protein n=1 Tax=Jaapia argillacea MUCL 33604 TaxID=933084 RepID=A0A067PMU1_9AGAM|nr:hypothetical protein JAAARDRAFT_198240 [Jaapia argillacea MUCL 33604]